MATIEAWMDVETEVERVFGVYLGTTLGLNVNKSDSDADLAIPRIDIVAIVEQMGPHRWQIPSGTYSQRWVYDQFSVSLHTDLIFSPYAQANIAATVTSSTLRGKLRRCLSDWAGLQAAFVSGGLLNIARDSIRQTSGDRQINNDEKTEKLTTVVSAMIFLNTDVIPT